MVHKASEKTSVQQFTSIFNDIRMSSSRDDSFQTSHNSAENENEDEDLRHVNTGNFYESQTIDSMNEQAAGPRYPLRPHTLFQQDSHETDLDRSNMPLQDEPLLDQQIDLTLVDS